MWQLRMEYGLSLLQKYTFRTHPEADYFFSEDLLYQTYILILVE